MTHLGRHQRLEGEGYLDVASQKAKSLATELSGFTSELRPHFPLLLEGSQKQTYSFGQQLILEVEEPAVVFEWAIEALPSKSAANPSLILGMLQGLYHRDPQMWSISLSRISSDESIAYLFPRAICTGETQASHLAEVLELVRSGLINPAEVIGLSYGRTLDGLPAQDVADFCVQLVEFDVESAWTALDVFYMYCFGREGVIETVVDQAIRILTSVPLYKTINDSKTDAHQWFSLAERLLDISDREVAVRIAHQLIDGSKHGYEYGDLWHYFKPMLIKIMKKYGDVLWPIFGNEIVSAEGMRLYWLSQLMDRDDNGDSFTPSILSIVSPKVVIKWCKENPENAPTFVAESINIFDRAAQDKVPSDLFVKLLENFGNDPKVASMLSANMSTRGWSGSLVPYLEADKAALSTLFSHRNSNVVRWVRAQVHSLDRQILGETSRDEERDLGIY